VSGKFAPAYTVAASMVSGLALGGEANTAAMLCQYNCFSETAFFVPQTGEPLIAGFISYDDNLRGIPRLLRMVTFALQDLQFQLPPNINIRTCPWVITLPEQSRTDWTEVKHQLFLEGLNQLYGGTASIILVREGRVAAGHALSMISTMLYEQQHPYVVLLSADSLVNDDAIHYFGRQNDEYRGRLLCDSDPDGFIPGELAAAVCFTRADLCHLCRASIVIKGVGEGREPAILFSGEVLHGTGLTQAMRAAAASAQCSLDDTDFRIIGLTGESYFFREAALVLPRVITRVRPEYPLWHIADKVGECGSANGTAILAFLHWAALKNQLPGKTGLCHISNDDEQRVAFIFEDCTHSVAL
jgi:3-oxoacyl-[acyl-carrier-protein] synthase I